MFLLFFALLPQRFLSMRTVSSLKCSFVSEGCKKCTCFTTEILSACQTKSDTFSWIVNKWSTSANFQFKLSLSRSREDFRLRKETDIHTSHVIWNLNDNIIVYACQVCYYSYWKDTFLLCVCGIYVSVLRVDTFMDLKREWKTESFDYSTCFYGVLSSHTSHISL